MNRYVVCLKHGTKYGPEYVNTLEQMVRRYCTFDFQFVCFTENPKGLTNTVKVMDLPTSYGVNGWWFKPLLFNPVLPLGSSPHGTILYIDLDVVVFKNIDKLFTYKPDEFCVIRDFNRSQNKTWEKFNSSVVRWNIGQHPQIYTDFIKNPSDPVRRFHGDQDWLYAQVKKDFQFWPDEWIMSYKWEMRGRPPLVRKEDGKRDFASPGVPTVHPDTSIAVFHGDPNPKECQDPWCKEHWR
jgi:hypothetical protein